MSYRDVCVQNPLRLSAWNNALIYCLVVIVDVLCNHIFSFTVLWLWRHISYEMAGAYYGQGFVSDLNNCICRWTKTICMCISVSDLFAKYNCTYCQEDITGLRIKCAECTDFDLCLQVGQWLTNARICHARHVIGAMRIYGWSVVSGWGAQTSEL